MHPDAWGWGHRLFSYSVCVHTVYDLCGEREGGGGGGRASMLL